jgi:phenylalanyl-tRNA synthetase beta chain
MKISYNWLNEFINIPLTPEETGDILTDIGLEVEKIETIESIKGGLQNVLIGQVKSVFKHPDADRLKVTTVDVGKEELFTIVCGASNVAEGQKVIVALPGSILYPSNSDKPIEIKLSKIRGVESQGMICAEDEIGIGSSHEGIMVLEDTAKIGLPAAAYFEILTDSVFEIGLTPNRTDAMSHYGVARDLLAALKFKGLLPADAKLCRHRVNDLNGNEKSPVTVSVEHEDCIRYSGIVLSNISIGESPKWIKDKLKAIGLKSINNVVDITNYVLHETGQPLHAFDLSVVKDKIVVKKGMNDIPFIALDDVSRNLHQDDLMICNAQEAMCIAGVFGGKNSGVSNTTTSIFLESAYFHPVSVRKTAKRIGLSTDASYRFERGIDPNNVLFGLKRAVSLLEEIAGAKIEGSLIDYYPHPIQPKEFSINISRISLLCGIQFEKTEILQILENLEIEATEVNQDVVNVKVPAYRVDVTREADIAEEILRIYGFNNVPIPEKLNTSIIINKGIDKEKIQNHVADFLTANGFFEGMSNSLTKSSYHQHFSTKTIKEEFNVNIINPLSNDLSVLRQSLLFGILEAIHRNQNYGNDRIKLYEFGNIYHHFNGKYQEEMRLTLAISGKKGDESWNSTNDFVNFYTLKGVVESLLLKLGLQNNCLTSASNNDLFADGMSYSFNKKNIVTIGWLTKKIRQQMDIKNEVFIADFNWVNILELTSLSKVRFKELNKFPAVQRDLSLLIDKEITFDEVCIAARKVEKKLLQNIQLFDVYEGNNLPDGKKSYAVRFTLMDETKTLQDKEIESVMKLIQDSICNTLSAQLR